MTKAASKHEMKGERRTVTILFADLVGSTSTAAEMDPEDVMELLQWSRDICGKAVERYGGRIAKFMGDGIMAIFGYPEATEQTPQRALNAALEMVEGHRTAKGLPRGIPRPALRVGVHTGLVVIADIMAPGTGGMEEGSIVGATPNLASRVQGVAKPNCVVMSEDSAREVEGQFETRSLGRPELKGISRPVEVFEVLARREIADQAQRVDRVPGLGMVGRAAELRQLAVCWQQSLTGPGCAIQVSGEAGLGKSRLVAEFLQRQVTAEDAKVFFFQCTPYHRTTSLYPVARCLAELLELSGEGAVKAAELQASLAAIGVTEVEDVQLIQTTLGLPLLAGAPPLALPPEARKARTFAALTRCFEGLRQQAPAVLIFNDVHWIDGLTREWLVSLCQLQTPRCMVLATTRPEGELKLPQSELVQLTPLSETQTREMATAAAAGKVLPREVLQHISRHSGGVPLFVAEMTRSIIQSEVLVESETHFAVLPGRSIQDDSAVPLTLQELLLKRVDAAGAAKHMLQLCAVIGEDFPAALPPLLWSQSGYADGENFVVSLTTAGLLEELPDGRLSFQHALLRHVTYEATIKTQRVSWHRHMADYLKAGGDSVLDADPAVVANHYALADRLEDAVNFALLAAKSGLGRSAYADAALQCEQGLSWLPEGWEEMPEMRVMAAHLASFQGVALLSSQGFTAPEVESAFLRAEAYSRLVGTPEAIFPSQWGLWCLELMRGRLAQAESHALTMMKLGTDSRNSNFLIEGRWTLGAVYYYQGRLAEAREMLEQAVAMYGPEHAQNAYAFGQDPCVAARTYLTFVLCYAGYTREAEEMVQAAVALAGTLNHPYSTAFALGGETMLRLGLADMPGTLVVGRKTMQLCMEHEIAWWLCVSKLMVGLATAHAENPALGYQMLEEALDVYENKLRTVLVVPAFCAMLADAAALNGERNKAVEWAERGLRMAESNEEQVSLTGVLLICGQLKLTAPVPDLPGAEAHFRRALSLAHGQGARLRELQAAAALAQLLVARGDGAEAHATLQPLAEWFEKEQHLPLAAAVKQFFGMLSTKPAYG